MIEFLKIILALLIVFGPMIVGFIVAEVFTEEAIWPIVVGGFISLAVFGWFIKQSEDTHKHNCDVAGGKLIHTGYQIVGKAVMPVYECVFIVDHDDELTTPVVRTK